MDQTPGARRLSFLVRAPGEAFLGIPHEIITSLTEIISGMVEAAAMQANHRLHSLMLSRYAGMLVRHCRLFDEITL
jgi:hypothetical protein